MNYKNGKTTHTEGYILVKKRNHPSCNKNGYVPEHRLVMEEKIGRYCTLKCLKIVRFDLTAPQDVSQNIIFVIVRFDEKNYYLQTTFGLNRVFKAKISDVEII